MKDLNQITVYQLNDKKEKQLLALKERYSRWQDKRINLLTFSINLFFTIAIAAIGLIINNYDKDIFKEEAVLGYSLPKITLVILVMSASMGVLALWSRLYDFRLTTRILKKRILIFKAKNNIHQERKEEQNSLDLGTQLACLKCSTKFLGKITWGLFLLQSALILLGIIMIIQI